MVELFSRWRRTGNRNDAPPPPPPAIEARPDRSLPGSSAPGGVVRDAIAQEAFRTLPGARTELERLNSSWTVRRFVFVLAPLALAELQRHGDDGALTGEIAYWVFTRDGCFLGNDIRSVTPETAAQVRIALLAIVAARPDEPERFEAWAAGLRSLDRGFRLGLLRHVFADAPDPILAAIGFAPGAENRFSVTGGDGGMALLIDDSLEWPISMDNNDQAGLGSGWDVAGVVTCFAPLLMLELRHAAGAEATWVLDGHCRRIDDESFAHPDVIALLRAAAPGMIRRHWQQILSLRDTRPGHVPLPFLLLNTAALQRLLYRVRDLVIPETTDLMLADPQPPIVLPPSTTNPEGLVLPSDHVVRAVRHGLFEAGLRAARPGGRFCWPSPIDGSDALLEAVFAPQEYTMVYQFLDRNGLRFMVATGERDCVLLGLYLPDQNQFLCQDTAAGGWFRQLIPIEFWLLLYDHCLVHRTRLAGRARGDDAEIVNVFMAEPLLHIGHYVWNDITGQAAIDRALGVDAPRSIIIGAPDGGAEFLGPVERLFPAMAGKVDRHLRTKSDFVAHVLDGTIVPVRMTRSFVDAALRDTVMRHVDDTGWTERVARDRQALGGGPVLIAGLRLEDRTFADPPGFYEALIDHLHQTMPGAILVLDGRNTRPGGGEVIASIKDHNALRSPLVVEQELVTRLRAHAATRTVSIASTVGLPIEASLAWCSVATACISPWGAGLAKYRWIANLPSVVLTSRHNLLHRHDLDIYHAPTWMESPSPLLLPDPDKVTDRHDVNGNAPAPTDAHGRECFEIDLPHVWSLLDRLLGSASGNDAGHSSA